MPQDNRGTFAGQPKSRKWVWSVITISEFTESVCLENETTPSHEGFQRVVMLSEFNAIAPKVSEKRVNLLVMVAAYQGSDR